MINEAYVSFEVAKLLKEKGFDCPCKVWYSEYTSQFGGEKYTSIEFDNHNRFNENYKFICSTPTIQMTIKWLREVYKLHIYAEPYWPQGDMRNKMSWQGFIVDLNTIDGDSQCYADSYEEAIENRIRFALENLI